jgi:carotenoid 1,2-hydratase
MNLLSGVEQDFHRPQKLPGAYEWWHFDGTDDRSGYTFTIQFHAGNLFSAYYQDSLKTYWEKTKSPLVGNAIESEAPNPLDYCGVSFRLFYRGAMVVESLQEFSQKSLKASDKYGAVLLGPNRFNWDQRGDQPSYVLTVQAPIHGDRTTVRVRLFFTPNAVKITNFLGSEDPEAGGLSTHTWVLAAPWCHVEGTLEWVNREGEPLKVAAFLGEGYHDHHFGAVPPGRFIKAWHWGHARLGEENLVYSVQVPEGVGEPEQTFLLSARGSQTRLWNSGVVLSKKRWNFFGLPYKKRLDFPGCQSLRIDHSQILGDGPAHLLFGDKVRWNLEDRVLKGRGLSSYLYTPRLSSPFFFPLLKGKSLIVQTTSDTGPLPPPSDDVSTTRPVPLNKKGNPS